VTLFAVPLLFEKERGTAPHGCFSSSRSLTSSHSRTAGDLERGNVEEKCLGSDSPVEIRRCFLRLLFVLMRISVLGVFAFLMAALALGATSGHASASSMREMSPARSIHLMAQPSTVVEEMGKMEAACLGMCRSQMAADSCAAMCQQMRHGNCAAMCKSAMGDDCAAMCQRAMGDRCAPMCREARKDGREHDRVTLVKSIA